MKRLYLTSSIGSSGVASSVFKKLAISKPRTAFIITPVEAKSETSDLGWLDVDRNAMKEAGFDVFDYTITGKNQAQIKQELSDVDVIYMSGGNTNYLLDQSQKSGFIPFIQDFVERGKPYVSTSAGSIISGSMIPPYLWGESKDLLELKDYSGYKLVNFTILPHWGSPHFRDKYLGGRIEQIYDNKNQPFILLTDNQYVEVKDGWYSIVDVSKE